MSKYREARRAQKKQKFKKENQGEARDSALEYQKRSDWFNNHSTYLVWAGSGGVALGIIYLILRAAMWHALNNFGGAWGSASLTFWAALEWILFLVLALIYPFFLAYCRSRFQIYPLAARAKFWAGPAQKMDGMTPRALAAAAAQEMPHAPLAPWRLLGFAARGGKIKWVIFAPMAAGWGGGAMLIAAVLHGGEGGVIVGFLAGIFAWPVGWMAESLRLYLPRVAPAAKDDGRRGESSLATIFGLGTGSGDE